MPHISITAEPLVTIAGFTITNSILTTWLVMALLIILGYVITRSLKQIPGNIQSIGEIVIGGLYNLFKSITGEENANRFFPLLATFFIFIIAANWIGLVPGVGTIGLQETHTESTDAYTEEKPVLNTGSLIDEHGEPVIRDEEVGLSEEITVVEEVDTEHGEETKLVPLFRGPTADLNTTLALALLSVSIIQYYGIKSLGLKIHLSKFFNFSNPIYFYVGILELISEISRILSFAFRLFGNIFAGEVLLAVIAFLIPLIVPLPFLGLEIFVGFIQALVFAMLTAVFLAVATTAHSDH